MATIADGRSEKASDPNQGLIWGKNWPVDDETEWDG
jgi:hypothetical protein